MPTINLGPAGPPPTQGQINQLRSVLGVPGVVAVPASAGATGSVNQVAWDANFIYICVATNTWVRAPLATW